LNKINILDQISLLDKPYIIYRSKNGFTLYTNFSKKIILTKKNISSFLKKTDQKQKRIKKTDLYVGFFGYEILNDLIKVNIPKQKETNFPKGIFYKPENIINLSENLKYQPEKSSKIDTKFKINIDRKNYTKIFNKFKNKIKKGETYQIKICTKYRNKSKIDPLDYFCRLTKTNLAPEAFLIKDKEYSIISCSPETLIIKKGNSISTKPIAGTLKKNSKLNKIKL
jgi:para-aminobenzoate synthetase component 1